MVVEERGAEVEVSEVDRPKEGILGHNSIEGGVEGRQRGGVGRRRAGGREAVNPQFRARVAGRRWRASGGGLGCGERRRSTFPL